MAGELLKATYNNTQSSNWTRYQTSELISEGKLTIGDGYRAKNSELCSLKSGLVFARAGNINQGFKFDNADYLAEKNLIRAGEKISEVGDVLFTSKGTVGRVAFVSDKTTRFVYSPQLSWWRIRDRSLIEPRFLYYWMFGREFFLQINSFKGQTDMADCVSLKDQRQMYITLPPLSEQKAIAHILGTLDDKIELNQQMNGTLEAIAQAIFKSWFVDFDPVRAKMDGRQPAGMDAATADLFPDEFEDSPLGKIPKGWSQYQLGDFLTLKRGYDLPTPSREIGTVPIISSSGFSGWHSTAKVKEPGVVTGRYGTIGKVFFVNEEFWPLNTTLYVEDFKGNEPRVAYYLLKSIDFNVYVDKAAVPGVNRNHVHQESIVAPPLTVQRCFSTTLEPLWQKQSANTQEVKTLTAIRDTLLPKLMSGEIRMKEVETLVKAA
jgi:type I restriction enzyme, S subunit